MFNIFITIKNVRLHVYMSSVVLFAFVVGQLFSPMTLLAASSTFTTSIQTYGTDNTPPSIPVNLVATAVSYGQIDLSWSPSTDDFGVGGYRIFRDGQFLATSTVATFSDTGLLPVTSYSYAIEAFDFSFNLSGQSQVVSTTTLEMPVQPEVPPIAGGQSPKSKSPIIYDVQVLPTLTEAALSFRTNMSSQAKVFWGKTTDYESGSLSALFYGNSHKLQLTGLETETEYFVRIETTNYFGTVVHFNTSFRTLAPVSAAKSIANPSDFRADSSQGKINLSWNNPVSSNFEKVRVVRSDTFFPKDQFDGFPVYEGKGQSFVDMNIAEGKDYYYAIFAISSDGLVSSGALAKSRSLIRGQIQIPSGDPFAGIQDKLSTDPKINALTLNDFEFIQEGKLLAKVGNEIVAVNGSENLTVRISYEKVPEILKTIAITLKDPQDPSKAFPFLLRINKQKTYYEATIAPLGRSGKYGLSIIVLDYMNNGLKRINGNLQAIAFASVAPLTDRRYDGFGIFVLLLLLLAIVIAFKVFAGWQKNFHKYSNA